MDGVAVDVDPVERLLGGAPEGALTEEDPSGDGLVDGAQAAASK
jgi:hypothetical protein